MTVSCRVFDDPNHPQYGPIRRAWVVLVQLDLLDAAERMSAHGVSRGLMTWDACMARSIAENPHVRESRWQRAFIYQLMEGWV